MYQQGAEGWCSSFNALVRSCALHTTSDQHSFTRRHLQEQKEAVKVGASPPCRGVTAHLSHLQPPAPVWTASTSAQTLQDPGRALGCRWSQCHSSLVICNQATKFQVSSGWKGEPQSAPWTAQRWRCKPTRRVYGTSWCFGNASAAVGTLDGRDVNRLFIHSENLLHIYTCTSLPVKQHQVNYTRSEAFKPCDLTGRGKLKAGHLLIMKAFTEARLFYLFTVWY